MWKDNEEEKKTGEENTADRYCTYFCNILSASHYLDVGKFLYVLGGNKYELWCDF